MSDTHINIHTVQYTHCEYELPYNLVTIYIIRTYKYFYFNALLQLFFLEFLFMMGHTWFDFIETVLVSYVVDEVHIKKAYLSKSTDKRV